MYTKFWDNLHKFGAYGAFQMSFDWAKADMDMGQLGRYGKMIKDFGPIAAYLLVKVETKTLTKEDVDLAAIRCPENTSTMIRILCGALETLPYDLEFLTNEAIRGIAFDLKLDAEKYLKNMGLWSENNVWEEK